MKYVIVKTEVSNSSDDVRQTYPAPVSFVFSYSYSHQAVAAPWLFPMENPPPAPPPGTPFHNHGNMENRGGILGAGEIFIRKDMLYCVGQARSILNPDRSYVVSRGKEDAEIIIKELSYDFAPGDIDDIPDIAARAMQR